MQWQDVNPSHCIFYLFISLHLSTLTLLSHSPLTIGFNIVFPYLASYLCPKKLLLS